MEGPAVLIYDGECSVCRKAVEWIRARARPGSFEFLSLHSGELAQRFPHLDPAACRRAAHLLLPAERFTQPGLGRRQRCIALATRHDKT